MIKSTRDFKYKISAPKTNHWEMTEWCEEKFGKRWSVPDYREGTWCVFWGGRYAATTYDWHFLNEQDAIMFSLRWL